MAYLRTLGQLSLLNGQGHAEVTQKFFPLNKTMTWLLNGRTDRIYRPACLFASQVAGSTSLRPSKEGEQPTSESTVWLTPEEFSDYPFAKPQQKIWTILRKMKNS